MNNITTNVMNITNSLQQSNSNNMTERSRTQNNRPVAYTRREHETANTLIDLLNTTYNIPSISRQNHRYSPYFYSRINNYKNYNDINTHNLLNMFFSQISELPLLSVIDNTNISFNKYNIGDLPCTVQ